MTFTVLESGLVQADFPDAGLDPFTFEPGTIPQSLFPDALIAGVVYNMRSATSKLVGVARTPVAMREALVTRWASITSGKWMAERAVAGEGGGSFTLEQLAAFLFRQKRHAALEAKAEKNGTEVPEFTATLAESAAQFAALDDEQKAKLKAVPLYQMAFAEVKAEAAAAKAAKLAKKMADVEAEDF
jgi:hypothetical protein